MHSLSNTVIQASNQLESDLIGSFFIFIFLWKKEFTAHGNKSAHIHLCFILNPVNFQSPFVCELF